MEIFCGELIGTMFLILLGDGVVANSCLNESKGHKAGWFAITAGWGLAVTLGVYISGWASGGHLNPAVTLAMASLGRIPAEQIPLYIGGQLIGAFLGAVLVWLAFLPHWSRTEDVSTKLGVFCTIPAIRHTVGNLLSEVIGTVVLVVGALSVANKSNKIGDGFGPVLIGLIVVSIGLSLGGPTGYAINPARDLMPRLAHALLPISGKGTSDWSYAWIPIIGPIIGGILGAIFYTFCLQGLTPLS
jgi:glycerol uptake facilitator protein